MSSTKKILIVGAGPGGLTAGMLLAHRGFEVHIYEKGMRVGGRNASISAGGHTFDVGPTFLLMKFILDEMFREVGRTSSDYLSFVKLDPMYSLRFGDTTMKISSDRDTMKAEIARLFPGEEDGYDRFMEEEGKRFAYMYPCLQKDYSTLAQFLHPDLLRAAPHIPLTGSLFDQLGKYFKSEQLRLAFTFQAKYLGMSPWECPAFFIMVPYLEHKYGIYHVEGGLSKISDAMATVVTEEGGSIHLGQSVRRILTREGGAYGIELESGEQVYGDEVILNADFAYAANNLFEPGTLRKYTHKRLESYEYSCSTFMLYLGLDRVYEHLDHHTIVFAEAYRKNISDIFEQKVLSDDFSFYVRNAVVSDTTVSPAGTSGLYVLVPTPNNFSNIDWPLVQREYRNRVIHAMAAQLGMPDLESHITVERMITPKDWEESLNVYKGAVFNIGHKLSQMLYFRPHNKFEEVEHVYLVGGGTHPGSGLPTIYESARISVNMLSKQYGVPFAPPPPLPNE
jgi:phytoene desaturase